MLKPNGALLLIVQKGGPDRVVDEPLDKIEKMFVNFFTVEKLEGLLSRAGFEIIEQREVRMPYPGAFAKSDTVIYATARKLLSLIRWRAHISGGEALAPRKVESYEAEV